jgi:hypothetical protein
MLNEILALPEIKALWTGNPLDLVGIGFFLLLLYALVGGTISMFKNQVKYITHAILKRRAAGEVHSYTKSLIDGTRPSFALCARVRNPPVGSGFSQASSIPSKCRIAHLSPALW